VSLRPDQAERPGLKPLPYPNPDRLVTLWETHPTWGPFLTVAPANFYDWRQQSTSFSRMAALDPYPDFILTGRGEPRRLAHSATISTGKDINIAIQTAMPHTAMRGNRSRN